MITHLEPTLKAFQKALGETVTKTTVAHGIKNIDGWLEKLETADFRGAKTIHGNLENLKKHLEADEPDPKAIGKLLRTLGEETGRVASHAEGAPGEKLKQLAELLTKSGGDLEK